MVFIDSEQAACQTKPNTWRNNSNASGEIFSWKMRHSILTRLLFWVIPESDLELESDQCQDESGEGSYFYFSRLYRCECDSSKSILCSIICLLQVLSSLKAQTTTTGSRLQFSRWDVIFLTKYFTESQPCTLGRKVLRKNLLNVFQSR